MAVLPEHGHPGKAWPVFGKAAVLSCAHEEELELETLDDSIQDVPFTAAPRS